MPIDLNTFRNAVQNVHNDSFVRMSGRDPEKIVNYGTSLLGRVLGWYRHGTAVQNQDVREKLFEALQGEGDKIQAGTIEKIRSQLGIDAGGRSSNVTQLSAREVKQIFASVDADNANFKARKDFAAELSKTFGGQYFRDAATAALGLNDPNKRIMTLDEHEKNAVLHEMRQKGIEAYDDAKRTLNLPSIPELDAMIPDAETRATVTEKLKLSSMEGKVSPQALIIVKGDINVAQLNKRLPEIEARLQAALAQLSQDSGKDCSALQTPFKDKLMKKLIFEARTMRTVTRDPAVFTDAIERNLAEMIRRPQEMFRKIQEAEPPFAPAIKAGMLELVSKDPTFNNFEMAKVMADFADEALGVLEYSREPQQTLAGLLEKISGMEHKYDLCARAANERLGNALSGEDLQSLSNRLGSLSRSIYQAKYGEKPQLSDQTRNLMMRFMSEMDYLLDASDKGNEYGAKYCYSQDAIEGRDGLSHLSTMMGGAYDAFGLGNETPEVPKANGISDDIGDYLVDIGLVGRREENPYGKVIEQKLGSLFQKSILDNMQGIFDNSTNESMTDYSAMYGQVLMDLNRVGIGMKMGDDIKVKVAEDHNTPAIADIQRFFEADQKNGINAARVISGIVHQGLAADFLIELCNTGEACGGMFDRMGAFALNFDVSRLPNGHYAVDVKYDCVPVCHTMPGQEPVMLDQSRSRLSLKFTMEIGIDPEYKNATVEFSRKPEIRSELYKTVLSDVEYQNVVGYHDPDTKISYDDEIYTNGEVMSDPAFKDVIARVDSNPRAVKEYLDGKIINHRDEEALYATGIDSDVIKKLLYGLHPEAKLTKDLMNRLTGKNRAEREQAFEELKGLYQILVDAELAEERELNLNDMALVTVGGLKMERGAFKNSELAITLAYIKSSDDRGVRELPEALNSNSTQRIALAKAFLPTVVADARRALGLDLLSNLVEAPFSGLDVAALKGAPDMDNVMRHLENVVLKNESMESSLAYLRNLAKDLQKK